MIKLAYALFLTSLIAGCVSSGKYDKLDGEFKEAQKSVGELQTENSDLKNEVNSYKDQINQQDMIINQLKTKLGSASSDVEGMKIALKEAAERKRETEKRMAEYSDLLNRFKGLIDAGKLRVKIVRGRMIVELESDILFSSGSATLSEKGKASIKEVTNVLVSIPNRDYQIEGHTDNVPIKTDRYPSNWELAAARGTSVLKTMLDSGMPAGRVSTASFGDTQPTNNNETPEEKAANRRIEIVVMPDLSSLPGFDELNKISE